MTQPPQKIWIQQCEATKSVEENFGVEKALTYLIGEKVLNFLRVAEEKKEWREEIPAFMAEIKTIFEPWQLAEYFERIGYREPLDISKFGRQLNKEEMEEAKQVQQRQLRQDAEDLLLVEWAKELLLGGD